MNRLYKNNNNIEIINGISIAFKCIALFIIGLGRYRICLFIASYFLIKPFLFSEFAENKKFARVFFVIFGIPLLYLDIYRGQIFQLYSNNLIIFFVSFALFELISKKYINSLIEKITNGKIFSYCKVCGFENIKLVNTCKNCLFNGDVEYNANKYNDEFKLKFELKINSKDFLSSKPTNRLLKILKFDKGEEVYFNIKIPFIRGIHKNGNKILCKNVIFTNRNIIFIDYKFYHRGWCYLERLQNSQFKNTVVGIKHVGISDYQLLEIVTKDNDKFEFFVSIKNLNEEQYKRIADKINNLLGEFNLQVHH